MITGDGQPMKELEFLRKIKSVTFASSVEGMPRSRIIDVMLIEEDKIYFTTARGKAFYRQLELIPYVAITGMDETYKSIRVHGPVKKVGREYIDKIFEENPGMNEIYPGEKRDILEPFCVYKGAGEIFDLSVMPPQRHRFAFGGMEVHSAGYVISDACTACGICKETCPENAIKEGDIYIIDGNTCLECGRCYENCPEHAIVPPKGL